MSRAAIERWAAPSDQARFNSTSSSTVTPQGQHGRTTSNLTRIDDIRHTDLGARTNSISSSSSDSSNSRCRISTVAQEPVWSFSAAASASSDAVSSRVSRSDPSSSPAKSTKSTSTVGSGTMRAMASLIQMPGSQLQNEIFSPPTPADPFADTLQLPSFGANRFSAVSSLVSSPRLNGTWSQDWTGRGSYRPSMGPVSPLLSPAPIQPLSFALRESIRESLSTNMPPISPPADHRAAIAAATLSVWDPESPMFMNRDRWDPPKHGYYEPEKGSRGEKAEYEHRRPSLKPTLTWPAGRVNPAPPRRRGDDVGLSARIDRPDLSDWVPPPASVPVPPPKDPGYVPRSRRSNSHDGGQVRFQAPDLSQSRHVGYEGSAAAYVPRRQATVHDIAYRPSPMVTFTGNSHQPLPTMPQTIATSDGHLIWDEAENQWVTSRGRPDEKSSRQGSSSLSRGRSAIGIASRLLSQKIPRRLASTHRVAAH